MTENPRPVASTGSKYARHEIAKGVLAAAKNRAERDRAIRTAMELGMPLHQIEDYLDWLEQKRPITDDRNAAAEGRRDCIRRPKPRR